MADEERPQGFHVGLVLLWVRDRIGRFLDLPETLYSPSKHPGGIVRPIFRLVPRMSLQDHPDAHREGYGRALMMRTSVHVDIYAPAMRKAGADRPVELLELCELTERLRWAVCDSRGIADPLAQVTLEPGVSGGKICIVTAGESVIDDVSDGGKLVDSVIGSRTRFDVVYTRMQQVEDR